MLAMDGVNLLWGSGVMRSVLRVVLVLSFVSALAGCATKTAIPYDRSSSGKVQTIGILEPGLPSTPSVVLASTVGQSFGLLGVLVDAGLQSSRDSKMTSILNNNNFVANKVLVDKLTVALQAKGYEVKVIPAARPDKSEFVSRYRNQSRRLSGCGFSYIRLSSGWYGR